MTTKIMQKFTSEEYNKLFVTSDTHFGHNKEFIYKDRGYNNVEEMNDSMINIINNTVGTDGILLHLGDFCLNTTTEQYNNLVRSIKVKAIWMLWGNHNSPIQQFYGVNSQQINGYNGNIMIRYLQYYYTFGCDSKQFVCFHYPIVAWNGQNGGSMHLCGHSHGKYPTSRPEHTQGKILDCGWDVHQRPLSMLEIESIMSKKKIA